MISSNTKINDIPVQLTINGVRISAHSGQTVLDVVNQHKLDDIPTLCYDPRLEPYGSCFLCVVEVKGSRGLLPACTTRIRDGMEVTTRNQRITHARKTALELLLSDHYADCVCPGQIQCPAGVDIQGYMSLARLGLYNEALQLIKERNPLPIVCGRVCVRKCEVNCRRGLVDQPVGINYIKRYVAEHSDHQASKPQIAAPSGKKVAIIGGGPAGLACAYHLARWGHKVVIFEAMPQLGGMLRYGIPVYRMPAEELDAEIREIIDLGVEVELQKKLGRDFTIEKLRNQNGFDAVFLALGAPLGRQMGVPGEEVDGVKTALDFLRDVELHGPPDFTDKIIAVVGGGNSAIDAARTAMRCKAKAVALLYRRTRKEMPAHHEEVDAAIEEGVELQTLIAPLEVLNRDGRLTALRCQRMELGAPDDSGRRRPVVIPNSEFDFACDYLFSAIGQSIDPEALAAESSEHKPDTGWGGTLKVDPQTMHTNLQAVFAGGDLVLGPSVVIDAIAHGFKAAKSINAELGGQIPQQAPVEFFSRRDAFGAIPPKFFEHTQSLPRQQMPHRDPQIRKHDFEQVELGLDEGATMLEALRCLECGCTAQFDCKLRQYAAEYDVEVAKLAGAVRHHKVDASHPLLTLDSNKCILCSRCIRVCNEVLGSSVFGFVGRGFNTTVQPTLGKPLAETHCIACGACVETCPTGAISAKLPYNRQGPWKSTRTPSACGFCSLACTLDFNIVADSVFWASSSSDAKPAEGDLCFRGRFGIALAQNSNRLRHPMIRRGEQLCEASWEEAIAEAARILQLAAPSNKPNSTAVLTSPLLTLEQSYLTSQIARAALHTDCVGSFNMALRNYPRRDLDHILGFTASTCSLSDLQNTELIILVGSNPALTHPVLAMRLRRAVRDGAKLVIINSSQIELSELATLWLDARRGTSSTVIAAAIRQLLKVYPERATDLDTQALAQLAHSVQDFTIQEAANISGVKAESIEQFLQLLLQAKFAVAIYDLDDTREISPDDLPAIAQLLYLTQHLNQPAQGLFLLSNEANYHAAHIAGLIPQTLPGGFQLNQTFHRQQTAQLWDADLDILNSQPIQNFTQRLLKADFSAALVIMEDLLLEPTAKKLLDQLDALVVIDHYLSPTAARANVVLPASSLAEAHGTIINSERRLLPLLPATSPIAGLTNEQILTRLSAALGHEIKTNSLEDIRREIALLCGITPNAIESAIAHRDIWPLLSRYTKPKLSALNISSTMPNNSPRSFTTIQTKLDHQQLSFGLGKG
jgi:formate dehydrogenase major subunit